MSLNMSIIPSASGRNPARFWDRNAQKYAKSAIKDQAGYDRTLGRSLELINGFALVHELGCGTGTTALRLAPHVGRIVGTDVSSEMIAIANGKAADAMIGNTSFQVAEAAEGLAMDGPYDAVLAYNLLHLIDDRANLLLQAYRKLRPGGLFISKTPCILEMNPLIRFAIPPMRVLGFAPPVSCFRSVDLEREIGRAGFAVEEIARHGSGETDARVFIVAQKPG
jgi:SAM-dependent methyltransferase